MTTRAQLEAKFRIKVDDLAVPYRFSSASFTSVLNDAVDEACKRKRLLFDRSTSAVCQITFAEDAQKKDLHDSIIEVSKAYLVSDSSGAYTYLDQTTIEDLDINDPLWREGGGSPGKYVVHGKTIELDYPVTEDMTMYLEVWRIPLTTEQMSLSPDDDSPIIEPIEHEHLLEWCWREYYDQRDPDIYNEAKVALHQERFEDHFGTIKRARLRREINSELPQRVKVY